MRRSSSVLIGKIIGVVFVLIFGGYGIIQFWKNYCFGLIEKLDMFLAKDFNTLIIFYVLIIIVLIADVIIHLETKKLKKGKNE